MGEQKDRLKRERERDPGGGHKWQVGSKGGKMTKVVVRKIKDYEDEGKRNDEEG